MSNSENRFDVLVSGAGPAGSAAVLALKDSGLKVGWIDKHAFPRDKVCGDFISPIGLRELEKIDSQLVQRLKAHPEKSVNRSTNFFVGKRRISFHWTLRAITMKRALFDQLLFEAAVLSSEPEFFLGNGLKDVYRTDDGVEVRLSDGTTLSAKTILGCDGAHSLVAKRLGGIELDRRHHIASIRAYYSNLQDMDAAVNEVYADASITPGYFWIFPLSDTTANVGIGMKSDHVSRHKVDLKQEFDRFISSSPLLKKKFEHANIEGSVKGFGLPTYSRKLKISGERFLLCGDAAGLIDPSTGEGIMQAIVSGIYAAERTIDSFKKQDFSADFNAAYDERVHGRFWKNMRFKAFWVNHALTNNTVLQVFGTFIQKFSRFRKFVQEIV